ncbi:hypothetical protein Tco_1252779, partial [Tanacetum coccineum]
VAFDLLRDALSAIFGLSELKLDDDEIVAEDQPYAEDASPMAHSPDDVPESDPEADPEEDGDEDPEEDPIDYPADGGDDGDDEMDIEEDEDVDMDIDEEDEDDEMDDEEAEDVLLPTRPDAPPPLPTSVPTSFPPLSLPTDSHREGRPEVNLPPRMGLGLALGPGYEVGESSAAAAARPAGGFRADYGFIATMDRQARYKDRSTRGWMMRQGTETVIGRRLSDMLFRDRRVSGDGNLGAHAHTRQLMETEAGMSREAWRRAMIRANLLMEGYISTNHSFMPEWKRDHRVTIGRFEGQRAMSELLETDRRRREEMRELRAADRTRQQQIVQTLTAVQTLQREMVPLQGLVATLQGQVTDLQGQVMTLQGQVTTLQGQQGPAGGPAQPELPEEAGSSS